MKDWERIPARRFAAHFSLCVLAVCISRLITQTHSPTAMIWGSAPYIGLILSFATQLGPPDIHASKMYCSITAVMLLYLDKAATALGKAAEPSFDNTGLQHQAVHFAIAFFVLSELEYRRQYVVTKGVEHFRNYLLDFLLADIDLTFNVSRHPSVYWYPFVYNKRIKSKLECHRLASLMVLDLILFTLIGGCFNYGITLMVNQGHTTDYAFKFSIANIHVFFNETSPWTSLLGTLVLSRFVRQANFITVWGILRASARALDWWNGNDTSSLDSQYSSTQDLEAGYHLCLPCHIGEKV